MIFKSFVLFKYLNNLHKQLTTQDERSKFFVPTWWPLPPPSTSPSSSTSSLIDLPLESCRSIIFNEVSLLSLPSLVGWGYFWNQYSGLDLPIFVWFQLKLSDLRCNRSTRQSATHRPIHAPITIAFSFVTMILHRILCNLCVCVPFLLVARLVLHTK